MIFKKLESFRYTKKLAKVFKNSQNSYDLRSGFIIKFHFDDFCGYGEASPLPFFSNENMKQVEWAIEELKAVLVINHQYNVDELLNIFKVFSKDCPSLNFALDVALYDILSQRKRLSISKYLNKNAIDKINFSAISFEGLHLNQSIKIKFGKENIHKEIKTINNISDKYPNCPLRIDFNRLCDLEDAIYICNELEGSNIEYIEEPLKFPLEINYKKLKCSIKFPIALDESIIDGRYKSLISLDLIDYAILKPSLFGSIKKVGELSSYLNNYNVKLIISSSLQTEIGNMAEINLASALELNYQHGLNNYAFFNNKYEAIYNERASSVDLQKIIGLGASWSD